MEGLRGGVDGNTELRGGERGFRGGVDANNELRGGERTVMSPIKSRIELGKPKIEGVIIGIGPFGTNEMPFPIERVESILDDCKGLSLLSGGKTAPKSRRLTIPDPKD